MQTLLQQLSQAVNIIHHSRVVIMIVDAAQECIILYHCCATAAWLSVFKSF